MRLLIGDIRASVFHDASSLRVTTKKDLVRDHEAKENQFHVTAELELRPCSNLASFGTSYLEKQRLHVWRPSFHNLLPHAILSGHVRSLMGTISIVIIV